MQANMQCICYLSSSGAISPGHSNAFSVIRVLPAPARRRAVLLLTPQGDSVFPDQRYTNAGTLRDVVPTCHMMASIARCSYGHKLALYRSSCSATSTQQQTAATNLPPSLMCSQTDDQQSTVRDDQRLASELRRTRLKCSLFGLVSAKRLRVPDTVQ